MLQHYKVWLEKNMIIKKKIKDILLSADNKPGNSFKVNYVESKDP